MNTDSDDSCLDAKPKKKIKHDLPRHVDVEGMLYMEGYDPCEFNEGVVELDEILASTGLLHPCAFDDPDEDNEDYVTMDGSLVDDQTSEDWDEIEGYDDLNKDDDHLDSEAKAKFNPSVRKRKPKE